MFCYKIIRYYCCELRLIKKELLSQLKLLELSIKLSPFKTKSKTLSVQKKFRWLLLY